MYYFNGKWRIWGFPIKFNKFIIWRWNGKLSLGKMCGVTLKRKK
jgi:hypothetical protein